MPTPRTLEPRSKLRGLLWVQLKVAWVHELVRKPAAGQPRSSPRQHTTQTPRRTTRTHRNRGSGARHPALTRLPCMRAASHPAWRQTRHVNAAATGDTSLEQRTYHKVVRVSEFEGSAGRRDYSIDLGREHTGLHLDIPWLHATARQRHWRSSHGVEGTRGACTSSRRLTRATSSWNVGVLPLAPGTSSWNCAATSAKHVATTTTLMIRQGSCFRRHREGAGAVAVVAPWLLR
jgi:hypothetical protein